MILAAAVIGLGGAFAQGHHHGPKPERLTDEERIAMKVERMQDRLGLDESQVQELKTLLAGQYEKRKEAREANRAEIEKILTPEQAETFKVMQAERARHHKAGPGHHRHHPGHHGCCGR